MAINKQTARKIAANPYKIFWTFKGYCYKPIPLYDKWGRFHGTVIYQKTNTVDHEKPEYIFFLHKNEASRPK